MKDRPLTLERYPEGISHDGFYQKQMVEHLPAYLKTVSLKNISKGGNTNYALCDNVSSLIYLVQLGALTLHHWLSKANDPYIPDSIVFDLDPPSKDRFDLVAKAALIIKDTVEALDLKPFIMTTGSSGAHVVVPITPELEFDEVRKVAKKISNIVIQKATDLITDQIRK